MPFYAGTANFQPWDIIGLSAGCCMFLWGFGLLRRRRKILEIPRSKIRSAALGPVEVSGLAAGPATLVAPITAQPCYYYSTTVYEWKKSGDDKSWEGIASECKSIPFFLDDDTGRVLVDSHGAELDIPREFYGEFRDVFFSKRPPTTVHNFLSRHNISTSNKIKVEEYCVKPNNALFVIGTLASNSSPQSASPIPPPTGDPDSTPQTVLSKGTRNKTFVVSTRSRQELVGTLGWQSAMMIWCGPIIALVSLYLLLDSMGLL